jgi:hypothetical protein
MASNSGGGGLGSPPPILSAASASKKVRSRPTSPNGDSAYSSSSTLGKLEELHIGGSMNNGCNNNSENSGRRAEAKGPLPPLPSFSGAQHKNSDLPAVDVAVTNYRKSRRSFGDESELSPISPVTSALGSLGSPGEKGSPSEYKTSPNGGAKGIPSPEQRRQTLTNQPLPHIEKDMLGPGVSRRSRTPEPLDPLVSVPAQRHAPVLEHLEKDMPLPNNYNQSQRRSRTPEPTQADLMSLPSQRHAPVLAHLEKDPSLTSPPINRRSRTPEPSPNDVLSAPVHRHAPTLEHLEHSSFSSSGHSGGSSSGRERDPVARRLDNSGDSPSDKYHLHDRLSESKPKKYDTDSKDTK